MSLAIFAILKAEDSSLDPFFTPDRIVTGICILSKSKVLTRRLLSNKVLYMHAGGAHGMRLFPSNPKVSRSKSDIRPLRMQ